MYVSDSKIFDTLFDIDLAEVFITSNAMATNEEAPAGAFRLNDVPGVAVVVEKAQGNKCARSWKILPDVGDDPEYPDVSLRDAGAARMEGAGGDGIISSSRRRRGPITPGVEMKRTMITLQTTDYTAYGSRLRRDDGCWRALMTPHLRAGIIAAVARWRSIRPRSCGCCSCSISATAAP